VPWGIDDIDLDILVADADILREDGDPTLSLSRLSDSQPHIAHEHQVKVARPSHVRFVEERPWLSNNA